MKIAEKDARITITILNRGGVLRILGSVTRRGNPLSKVLGNPTKPPPPAGRPRKPWKRGHPEVKENGGVGAAALDLSGHPKWTAINSTLGKEIETTRYGILYLHHQSSNISVAPVSVDKFSQRRRKWRADENNEGPAHKKRRN
ncbi:hypothetical protein TWF788_005258 [Orbilia oligospora]|uniref:Uncharacterized protein n=1 Tax=Orbilia oligospora TaxID=2813651 RepID=A0A7C8U2Q4_ORBOL|nr:hypothetical protein TWF788_005258 [Orbilia oligospora]